MAVRGAGGRFAARPGKAGFMFDSLTPGIFNYGAEISAKINLVMYRYSREMEQYAKDNAPWNDRSGDARGGLTATFEEDAVSPKIYLSHSVDYGVWLEIRWNGLYAVIMPTIEDMGPGLIREIRMVL